MTLQPGAYEQLPFEDYLAVDAANASRLKAARRSMAHAMVEREQAAPDHFDIGQSVHALILEGKTAWSERTAVRPECWDSWRTKGSKEWRDEQRAAGRTILTPADRRLVGKVAQRVAQHPKAHALLLAGAGTARREVSHVWVDEEYGVRCKCRFDCLPELDGHTLILDLKTTRDASPEGFQRSLVKFGYDLQAAHYWAGYEAVTGVAPLAYTIVAVETDKPYGVAVYDLATDVLERGRRERDEAMATWADWLHAGKPDDLPYGETINTLSLPRRAQ